MSGDSEMVKLEMSTAEAAFHGVAEAPRGAGSRAAGEGRGAARAALTEKIARLWAASGPDA